MAIRYYFSLAELDPSIADKNIIIADKVDGKPLPEAKGPLRIIAEGGEEACTKLLSGSGFGHRKN